MLKKLLFLTIFFLGQSCSSLFYQPNRVLYSRPEQFKISYDNIYMKSQDGVELHGWHLKAHKSFKKPKGFIIFFHGNAQNLSSHYYNMAWSTKEGYDIFIFDYRGYGLSDGKAEPDGVYMDALAGLNKGYELYKKSKAPKLIVYGQSLGGAISSRAVVDFKYKDKIDLLVLDSTFSSYKEVAFDKAVNIWLTFLFSPLTYLLFSDEYAPKHVLSKIDIPTLVIHGTKDRVIPYKFGKKLYDKLKMKKKEMWTLKDGVHTDIFFRHDLVYRQKFIKYLETI